LKKKQKNLLNKTPEDWQSYSVGRVKIFWGTLGLKSLGGTNRFKYFFPMILIFFKFLFFRGKLTNLTQVLAKVLKTCICVILIILKENKKS
jgi:hypothetical protein